MVELACIYDVKTAFVKNSISRSNIMILGIYLKILAMLLIREIMPRNTAASKQKKSGPWPNVMRFVASLLFLFVVFTGAGMNPPFNNVWLGGAGSIWLPIVFGIAVLGSIGLFFSSLAGLAWGKGGGMMAGKIVMFTSLALVILTASPSWSSSFWVVILGFLIGTFGNAMEMMM